MSKKEKTRLVLDYNDTYLAQARVTPKYYADPQTGKRGVHFSKMFTEPFLWTKSDGIQLNNISLKVSALIGTPPITPGKR